ncbi:MAG: hypothetical protein COT74_01170 [Bdellovibrionales bacterium CG10_big_fil_rev_8_21_14_0_10_45_34]|nr:MAG: hypothetical protein COT74_01170 [Bdellovibrionales bacterium CG10_big_fil_rev_8_21_14_0_10_45_34]
MVALLVILGLSFNAIAHAGIWVRVNDTTLRFSGQIQKGDLEKLENILKPEDKTLFLDSTGGDAQVGVRLAIKLLPNKLNIVVDGICASSCANYLFPVGYNKEIRRGWVGFHGNVTAFLAIDWQKVVVKLKEDKNLTDEQIAEFHQRLLASSKLEEELFAELGVSQTLFDRTQTPDKGMHNDVAYSFLVPKPETFIRYGIQRVKGSQDLTYRNAELGLNNLYD